ncbi:MAG: CHAD domain-containing protein [Bacteroidia bacterium]|nr:CHAD domain-containing protein [Bacteroidia bacterium]
MKAIKKYLKKRVEAICFLLKKPKQAYNPATFHKLRIETKKVNALFEIIKICTKDFKRKKAFKPYKLISHHAGKVREIQVEEKMLKKYFINNSLLQYRDYLMEIRINETETYFSMINKKLVHQLQKKYHKIVPFLTRFDKKKVATYMKKKSDKINELLHQKTLQTPQLHLLRKKLKKLNYNRKSMNFGKPSSPLPKKDVLCDLIGKWHDCQVIDTHLKKVLDTAVENLKEVNQLKKIKAKISSDALIILAKINLVKRSSEFM